jgi:hypothetical protein
MYFYILLKRGKVNLTDVYNASVNYDIPNTHCYKVVILVLLKEMSSKESSPEN